MSLSGWNQKNSVKTMKLKQDELIELYRTMLKIRLFEEKVKSYFVEGLVPGATHLYIGQEASATGICANLRSDDYIISTHRGHGHCIAKGGDLNLMMAELFGKVTGYCKGKGGSMHIADLEIGILGANGIVGGGLPIICGAGLSAKYRETDQVAVCFFGDGASNQGTFHEAINFASILHLPVIFVCENNQYAVSTRVTYSVKIPDIAERSHAYDIEHQSVDGNNVLDVYRTAEDFIGRARKGEGPFFIETKTYRWEGHYVGDQCHYRNREESEKIKREQDPLKNFSQYLLTNKYVTKEKLSEIYDAVGQMIEAADQFAQQSPEPDVAEVLQDVYV